MNEQTGYVQVYTGNGKGKTTASIGLAIRALGAGKKVLMIQFMKSMSYSEHKILQTLSPALKIETVGKPYFIAKEGSISKEDLESYKDTCVVFPPGNPPQEYRDLIASGIKRAEDAVRNGKYDLVILDEINCALYFDLISFNTVADLIANKCASTELVFTGRGAPPELIAMADLVTEMKEVKHYYSKGVMARRGIEN
jgi:cob(I)alamin adenosyltransferase